MKANILVFLFAFVSISLQAQVLTASDVNKKWGKPTVEELAMTTYAKDTSANAVVLYQQRSTIYDYVPSKGFRVMHEIAQKIKILKTEGKEEGNIEIPYFFRSNGDRELISGLEAYTYNLVNGKIVKLKLDKDYLFDEMINKNFHRLKFSLPDVKVGSVIEFKYNLISERVSFLPDWDIQRDIPVMNNDFSIAIPEYFEFNIAVKGFEMLDIKEKMENMQFNVGQDASGASSYLTCTVRQIRCVAQDIPALRDENHVWCLDDYLSGVRYELKGTRFPNQLYKPFTLTWEDLEKTIHDESDMPLYLKTNNPWKEETAKLIEKVEEDKEKIDLLLDFVKKRVRWNESYALIGDNPKDAVKNGTGSNAQINYLIMSVLRDAGYQTYPVLLSLRTNGRLPLTHPSINKLSTFIVAAMAKDSSIYYMDGSSKYGGANVLPENLLVDKARVYDDRVNQKWVDLSKLGRNFQVANIEAKLDKDGLLTGVRKSFYSNQLAYDYKNRFASAKDSSDFIKQIQNKFDVVVDTFDVSGKETKSSRVDEKIVFNKQLEVAGDFIYLNPIVFKHMTDNEFTQTERKLPVEFSYPMGYQTICNIQIPDNYQLVELPKSVKFVITGNKASCQFMASQTGNTVSVKYAFQLLNTVYTESEYAILKDFFGQAVEKNSEMLVLKKKS